MKYKFYSRNSKKKEAIGKVEAKTYREAVHYFAERKRFLSEVSARTPQYWLALHF